MDWSGFEPEAFPVQGGRYTRFNYQPPLTKGSIQFECKLEWENVGMCNIIEKMYLLLLDIICVLMHCQYI